MSLVRQDLPSGTMPVKEAYCGFLQHLGRLALSTQTNYRGALKRFIDSMPADLHDITAEDIERYILALHRTLKASSCNVILTAIKAFFRWLEDFEGVPNPARKIKLLKQLPPKQRILSQKEYQKVLASTTDHRRAMLCFLGNSGLRVSEFLNLRSESIVDGFITVLATKTRKERQVPINANIRQILTDNPDFFNLNLRKSRKWLYKQCCKTAKQANIEKFGPHSLRHYFITTMILKGVPVPIVARIAGDKVETILAIYTHIFNKDLVGATDCLV